MVQGRHLVSGKSKSCGCLNVLQNTGFDETGKKYGKWTVIKQVEKPEQISGRGNYFLCECSCSDKTQSIIRGSALRRKTSSHCGCEWKTSIRKPDSPFRSLFTTYVRSAKKRNILFNLSMQDIKNISQSTCYYCGAKPMQRMKAFNKRGFTYNGIDRTDNSLGYITKNCVPCCKFCNTAKMSMSFIEFKEWIKRVHSKMCS